VTGSSSAASAGHGQRGAELLGLDLTQLKPEQLKALVDQLDEMTLEVDQPDAAVRVFCE